MTALASTTDDLRSIGEVIAALRQDFPDISASKLRYLEAENLITPVRTSTGYRKFGPKHIERLRYILTLQRDEYLPLRVIRDRVEEIEAGRLAVLPSGADGRAPAASVADDASLPAVGQGEAEPGTAAGAAVAEEEALPALCGRRELLELSGLDETGLSQLEEFGLIVRLPSGKYDTDAIVIGRVAVRLADLGLEPRHLRGFRFTADREFGTLAHALAPWRRVATPEAQARTREALAELLQAFATLHDALLRIAAREF